MKKKLNSLLSLLLAIVALSPTAEADVLTVANGSDKNEFAPAFFYCGDEAGTKTVTIYPKAELTGLTGNITAMKFYLNGTFYFSSTPPAVEVKLAILDANTIIDDINDIDDAWGKGTLVAADVKPTNNLSYWEITFDTPFSYSGGDLVVMTNFKTKGKDSSKAFLGKNTTSVSAYCNKKRAYPNSSGLTTHNFLPKVDITYEKLNPYAANVSTTELDFGLVNVFDQTTTVNLTVFNTGANPITPNVSGLSEPFSTTYTPTEVAAGASVEVPVTITTDKVGMYTGSLTVDCGNGIDPINVAVTALAASYTHYGEETNFYAPIWHEKTQTKDNKSMVVYPADDISAMKDKIITGMTFYSTDSINPTTKPTIEVRLAKIDDISSISYSSIDAVWETGTTVAKSVMQTGDFYGVHYWNIVFDNEFTYTGGNLAFISNVDVAGSGEPRIYFYGVKTSDKRSFNTSAGNGIYSYFIPTTAWTFKEADAYDIKIDENMTNGTVYPDKTSASIGETVTLIADPADGYELENIAVNAGYEAPGSSGGGRAPRKTRILQGSIELTKVNDYTYTFVIPEKIKNALGDEEALKDNTDFLVSATFKETPVELAGVSFDATRQWATYIGNKNLAIPEGVSAYIVTGISGTEVTTQAVDYIPAGVGVLLMSETPAESVSTLAYTGESVDVTSQLVGNVEGMTIGQGYILYNNAFELTEGGTLAANRCYLPVSNAGNAPARLTIGRGTVTGINDLLTSENVVGVTYVNAVGQTSERPFKGFNIVVVRYNDGSAKTMKVVK